MNPEASYGTVPAGTLIVVTAGETVSMAERGLV